MLRIYRCVMSKILKGLFRSRCWQFYIVMVSLRLIPVSFPRDSPIFLLNGKVLSFYSFCDYQMYFDWNLTLQVSKRTG